MGIEDIRIKVSSALSVTGMVATLARHGFRDCSHSSHLFEARADPPGLVAEAAIFSANDGSAAELAMALCHPASVDGAFLEIAIKLALESRGQIEIEGDPECRGFDPLSPELSLVWSREVQEKRRNWDLVTGWKIRNRSLSRQEALSEFLRL